MPYLFYLSESDIFSPSYLSIIHIFFTLLHPEVGWGISHLPYKFLILSMQHIWCTWKPSGQWGMSKAVSFHCCAQIYILSCWLQEEGQRGEIHMRILEEHKCWRQMNHIEWYINLTRYTQVETSLGGLCLVLSNTDSSVWLDRIH